MNDYGSASYPIGPVVPLRLRAQWRTATQGGTRRGWETLFTIFRVARGRRPSLSGFPYDNKGGGAAKRRPHRL
jgi:hypothetical protein